MASCRSLLLPSLVLVSLFGCVRVEPDVAQPRNDFAGLVTAEETVAKELKTGAAPKVTVEMFNGFIDIVAGPDGAVKATVVKKAGGKTKEEAEAALQELELVFSEAQDEVRIAAVPPKGKSFHGMATARLEVPAGASLDLKTNLDRITVESVGGNIQARNSQGQIIIKDAKGDLNLTTSLAKIDVDSTSPMITAKNSQGPISIRRATGTVELTTSLARIDVDGPCTLVKAVNSQGSIHIRGATGPVELVTSLATIEVDAACTRVVARNSQGAITVKKAKGPLDLHTSLANIVVEADGAELEAVNSQGAIKAQGLRGRVKVETRLANINIEARDALLEAANSQGAVTFRGNLAAGKHVVHTSLGNVRLALPADASFGLNTETNLGHITNAFALKQAEKPSKTRLVGTVGEAPTANIQVNVSQGNVTIEKLENK